MADKFKGFDWQTEEDAFMDGYHQNAEGGEVRHLRARCARWAPTASRSRRSTSKDGKIVGTKRLYADGKFGGKDGKATFFEAQWRGLAGAGQAGGEGQVRRS